MVQPELGASLHRHQVEVLAMTIDEALDEWAVGQHRQPLRSCRVQCGFEQQRSQAFTVARRVDLRMGERDAPGRRRYSAKPRTALSTAISKRLRSETSVTVGGIASECALNMVVTCFATASGQFDGGSVMAERRAGGSDV